MVGVTPWFVATNFREQRGENNFELTRHKGRKIHAVARTINGVGLKIDPLHRQIGKIKMSINAGVVEGVGHDRILTT